LSPLDGITSSSASGWQVTANTAATFKLFAALDLTAYTNVSFTESTSACDNTMRGTTPLFGVSSDGLTARINVTLAYENTDRLYVCLDSTHQGVAELLNLGVLAPVEASDDTDSFPDEAKWVVVSFLLCLSGLFSGLNLGLMSLDTKELGVVMKVGSEEEKAWAAKIYPLRKHGNLLLCTVLLGNVLVNTVLTLLLDGLLKHLDPLIPIVAATLGIVIFGEIVPQAICTRHGLMIGANTRPIVLFFMFLTFPLAYPISRILDKLLGQEIGNVLNRKHIVELLKAQDDHNDLDKDEVEMVTGALTYADRDVSEIMTKLEDVYMLRMDAILDFKTVSDIFSRGHSRIPVFKDQRENIIGVLYMKELAFVDPDDCTELSTIIKFYKHTLEHVDDDLMLDALLEMFIQGRSHMVVVQKIVDPGDGRDAFRVNVGVATLEDVIEEIIQAEIVDETDVINDNKSKTMVVPNFHKASGLYPKELEGITGVQGEGASKLSEQMALAALTFLSANVVGFNDEDMISKSVLLRLINRADCVIFVDADTSEDKRVLYRAGQQITNFALILEGSVKVTVGSEQFSFKSGPFSSLGSAALNLDKPPVLADFTAVVETEKAVILWIPRSKYYDATTATTIGLRQLASTPLVDRARLAETQSNSNNSTGSASSLVIPPHRPDSAGGGATATAAGDTNALLLPSANETIL
jgi:metal transporter CNNM